jgi:hypothetical protein
MGGIGTLPMDYGQSLQVPQQQQPSFSSAQNITTNPLLNYGQPQLGQAGGTPLTMRNGGMSRLGYQEGGMGMMEDQDMMQQPMQSQQPQQMMQSPLQGMEGQQPDIKDPKQALELIIQMLIAQGIPPEQAREIAIQMVQAVAEGGVEEMSDQRIEARFGGRIGYASGGIGSLVDREQYGFGDFVGSVFKGAGKLVSGAVKAVKKVASSDIGKIALTVAAMYATGGGFSPQGFSMFGSSAGPGLLGGSGAFDLGSSYLGQGLFGAPTDYYGLSGGSKGLLGNLGITGGFGQGLSSGISSLLPGKGTLLSLGAGALGGALAGGPPQQDPGESDADYQRRVDEYKLQFQTAINNPNPQFGGGLYPNNPFYPQRAANGGRIGYQEGGIGDLIKQTTQEEFFGKPMMANGGRMQYAMGAEVPTRKNQAGVTELDYRKKGGFVPPIGIKEKADDIPAMLSNNEFVFTADAVRNAGNGSVNKGAERMYGLMKQLEAGGMV